ncbi:MAG TPA: hypothetical protein VL131_04635 [Gammaproteobacteria bacterium]|nr:hypothetical protein [Gammaproteobacteria bacterium]
MNVTRIFAIVITLGVLSTASSGQESQQPAAPPATPPAAPPATSPAAKPADAAPKAAVPEQSHETPPPPPSASAPKTGVIRDGEFIPTQEIQPDEDVTFPVDI